MTAIKELDVGNFTGQVENVAKWLMPYSKNLGNLYQGSIQIKLNNLKARVPLGFHTKIDDLIALNSKSKTNLYPTMLGLRELMPTLMLANIDKDNISLSEWIVQDWGGINSGDEGKFMQILKRAEGDHSRKIADNTIRTFKCDRIASWSKHLAFKYPRERAVYDAKVIYSLNWLLFKAYGLLPQDHQRVKYFPFLMGQNSAIGLLDYEIYLLFRDGAQDSSDINKAFECEVEERRSGSRKNSGFVRKIRKNSQIFIEEDTAYSEYCNLLQRLAEKLYPDDVQHQLTKTEMILFSIADVEIAKEVLQYISNVVTGKVNVASQTESWREESK